MEKQFHNVHDVYDGVINTLNGKINLKNARPEDVVITEVAAVMSKMCRFGGHVREFYSVAQHSVLVALLAPPELQREALLHDVPEWVLGDVMKPLKVLIAEPYTPLEDAWQDAVNVAYGLDPEKLEAVKVYDRMAVAVEHDYLQAGNVEQWNKAWLLAGRSPVCWDCTYAEGEFMSVYERIFNTKVAKRCTI